MITTIGRLRQRRVWTSVLVLLLTGWIASAQEVEHDSAAAFRFRLGAIVSLARNIHQTNASVYTGGGGCGAFSDGIGGGWSAAGVGEFPLIGSWLQLSASFGLAERGGSFGEATISPLPILDPNTDTYTQLRRAHDYVARLRMLTTEVGLRITPVPAMPAYLRLTTAVAFPLDAAFRQTERIASPEGVVFPETGTSLREVGSGPIEGATQYASVAAHVGYDLPLGRRLIAAPEVGFYFPLSDVVAGYRWRISTAQVGLALKWKFGETERPPLPPPLAAAAPSPPLPPAPHPLPPRPTLRTTGSIGIAETIVTETFPVLPYLFFPAGSAEIPVRYQRLDSASALTFDEGRLPRRSLDAYASLLNIVGRRMRLDTAARIRLNGTTDGREAFGSAAAALARSRAEAVRSYLGDVWGIDRSRIAIATTSLPSRPSNEAYAEGIEENRRVEISSENSGILRPIVHRRFQEYEVEPKWIGFDLAGSGFAKTWRLRVLARDAEVWTASGSGEIPSDLRWAPDSTAISRIAAAVTDSLRCELMVVGPDGTEGTTTIGVPVKMRQSPYELSRLSLIVFDFDRADIDGPNRRMVGDFVGSSIVTASTVSITGSTDRLGELAHNRKLSQDRADAVRTTVLAANPHSSITRAEGLGPSELPYDNALPEGRFYCRTVSVEITTPRTEGTERTRGADQAQ